MANQTLESKLREIVSVSWICPAVLTGEACASCVSKVDAALSAILKAVRDIVPDENVIAMTGNHHPELEKGYFMGYRAALADILKRLGSGDE